MRAKPIMPKEGNLFLQPLNEQINLKHPLVQLAGLMDWAEIDHVCGQFFPSKTGRTATPSRLIAGLLYLQHTYDLSDESVVWGWVENVYWQFFTGEEYLQTKPPIDPSSLTRWRQRLGPDGISALFSTVLKASMKSGALKKADCQTVLVDTTVMPKDVAYPTDTRLLEKARQDLVKTAYAEGLTLRQNYNQVAPKLVLQAGRYAHAKQFRRMRKCVQKLKIIVGRVKRDIGRQISHIKGDASKVQALLLKADKAIAQAKNSKDKLYAWHAPEVECIAKGKIRNPYEFGVKVSIATTARTGFVLNAIAKPGNPYDGHTLSSTVVEAQRFSGQKIKRVVVDRGYKAATIDGVQILRSGQRHGITPRLKALIKRRSCIEGTIGHMKTEGRLDRNRLKGELGDVLNGLLCGMGHNIRLVLRYLARFLFYILWLIYSVHGDLNKPSHVN